MAVWTFILQKYMYFVIISLQWTCFRFEKCREYLLCHTQHVPHTLLFKVQRRSTWQAAAKVFEVACVHVIWTATQK